METTIKTYASKSGARKGAKRAGLETERFEIVAEGERFAYKKVFGGNSVADEVAEKEATSKEPDLVCSYTEQVAPTTTKPTNGTGLKIEKDREERNGIKRPSIGGLCRAVWDECDKLVAEGDQPDAKWIREAAPVMGWNPNNASIEFYQWRKFNGITGRTKKA